MARFHAMESDQLITRIIRISPLYRILFTLMVVLANSNAQNSGSQAVIDGVSTKTKVLSCPDGWSMYKANETCFKVEDSTKRWLPARKHCKDLGGDLAVIYDRDTHAFVGSIVPARQYVWIGLSELQVPDDMGTWVDGEPMDTYFTYWSPIQRDNPISDGCGTLRNTTYTADFRQKHCLDLLMFVCQKGPTVTFPRVVLSCDDGWNLYLDDTTCFHDSSFASVYTEGRKYCFNHGGDLARILDSATEDFIRNQVMPSSATNPYWVGLHNTEADTTGFYWLDDTTPSGWHHLNTFVSGGRAGCVEMLPRTVDPTHHTDWNVRDCTNSRRSICQTSPNENLEYSEGPDNMIHKDHIVIEEHTITCPSSAWRLYEDGFKCIAVTGDSVDIHGARHLCHTIGGQLIKILNNETNAYITSLLSSSMYYWIALSDEETEREFIWEDGSPLSYSNWMDGEPNNNELNEDCVVMTGEDGKWGDRRCAGLSGTICQYDVIAEREILEEYTMDGIKFFLSNDQVNARLCYGYVGDACENYGLQEYSMKSDNEFVRLKDFFYRNNDQFNLTTITMWVKTIRTADGWYYWGKRERIVGAETNVWKNERVGYPYSIGDTSLELCTFMTEHDHNAQQEFSLGTTHCRENKRYLCAHPPEDTTTTNAPTTGLPKHPGSHQNSGANSDSTTTEPPTTTESPSTEAPTTTGSPSTEAPTTTGSPSKEAPTSTGSPSTKAPTTTGSPSTQAPTTTGSPSTEAPTTTGSPSTQAPTTTGSPSTQAPTTTGSPSTEAPTTTGSPSTKAPTTTGSPSTKAPTTTGSPSTEAPTTTGSPSTEVPTTTGSPSTEVPTTTGSPSTEAPTTAGSPSTESPTTTGSPSTESLTTTGSPSNQAPTTTGPPLTTLSTNQPTTEEDQDSTTTEAPTTARSQWTQVTPNQPTGTESQSSPTAETPTTTSTNTPPQPVNQTSTDTQAPTTSYSLPALPPTEPLTPNEIKEFKKTLKLLKELSDGKKTSSDEKIPAENNTGDDQAASQPDKPPNKMCPCACRARFIPDFSPAAINAMIASIQKVLKVDKASLSSARNKKESAPDERASSKGIGMIAVVFAIIPLAFILVIDLIRMYQAYEKYKAKKVKIGAGVKLASNTLELIRPPLKK